MSDAIWLASYPKSGNTSFNESEPVVCQPQEALDCFLRTRMDRLVIGDQIIERTIATAPVPRA